MSCFTAKLRTSLLPGVMLTQDRGATAVEYALLAALIGGVILLAVQALGGALDGLFGQSTSAVVAS